jgi:hypothetical protein
MCQIGRDFCYQLNDLTKDEIFKQSKAVNLIMTFNYEKEIFYYNYILNGLRLLKC